MLLCNSAAAASSQAGLFRTSLALMLAAVTALYPLLQL
jgi:hypothetical protein